jgi:hypothetical protein
MAARPTRIFVNACQCPISGLGLALAGQLTWGSRGWRTGFMQTLLLDRREIGLFLFQLCDFLSCVDGFIAHTPALRFHEETRK